MRGLPSSELPAYAAAIASNSPSPTAVLTPTTVVSGTTYAVLEQSAQPRLGATIFGQTYKLWVAT